MSNVIKLVKGDELPSIKLVLTDDITKAVLDLSNVTTVVYVYLKRRGPNSEPATRIECDKLNNGSAGEVKFDFGGGKLDVKSGLYEIEIVISYDGKIYTLYKRLKVRIKDGFNS